MRWDNEEERNEETAMVGRDTGKVKDTISRREKGKARSKTKKKTEARMSHPRHRKGNCCRCSNSGKLKQKQSCGYGCRSNKGGKKKLAKEEQVRAASS